MGSEVRPRSPTRTRRSRLWATRDGLRHLSLPRTRAAVCPRVLLYAFICVCGSGRCRHLEELAFDVDLDLVAHDELAIQHHVEFHAEVLAVDLSLRRIADPVTHVGVVEFAVL